MPTLPITVQLRFYAKVGMLYWNEKRTWGDQSYEWNSPEQKTSGHDLLLGVGAEYSFTKRLSVRLEYEHAQLGLGTLQGGIYWHF